MKKVLILAAIALCCVRNAYSDKGCITITGSVNYSKSLASVTVYVHKYGPASIIKSATSSFECQVRDQRFKMIIPSEKYPICITIFYDRLGEKTFYAEDGDVLDIAESNREFRVTGDSAYKVNFLEQIDRTAKIFNEYGYKMSLDPSLRLEYYNFVDSCTKEKLKLLNAKRRQLSLAYYNLAKGNILAGNIEPKRFFFYEKELAIAVAKVRGYRNRLWDKYMDRSFLANPMNVNNSIVQDAVVEALGIENCIDSGKISIRSNYAYIISHFQDRMREALILVLLHKYNRDPLPGQNISEVMTDASQYFKTPEYIAVFNEIRTAALIGGDAYSFSLPDIKGKYWHLSDFKDSVIVIDTWHFGCTACVETLPYMLKAKKHFEGKKVAFISLCFCPDKNQWLGNIHTYSADDILNLYSEGKGYDHPIVDFYGITGSPTLLLIDKHGKNLGRLVYPRFDEGKDMTERIEAALLAN